MNKYTRYGTAIVLAHLIVATAHGLAHKHLAIDLSLAQKLFVLAVITVAPLVSMLLLWTRLRKAGAALLSLSMAGSLIFGVINHFVIASADHVMHLPAGDWRFPFQLTSILLIITECLGCWIGAAASRLKDSV